MKDQLKETLALRREQEDRLRVLYNEQQNHIQDLQARISHSLPIYQQLKQAVKSQGTELTIRQKEAQMATESKNYLF